MTLKTDFDQYMEKKGFSKAIVNNYVRIGASESNNSVIIGKSPNYEEVGCIGTDFDKILSSAKSMKTKEKRLYQATDILLNKLIPTENIKHGVYFMPYPGNKRLYYFENKINNIGSLATSAHIDVNTEPKECYIDSTFAEKFKNIKKSTK